MASYRPRHPRGRYGQGEGNVLQYYYMSMNFFTHATPTLYNAGTAVPQLSSCSLLAMESDSIEGIFNTVKDCTLISK